MGTAVWSNTKPHLDLNSVANFVLNAATRFWFVVLLVGQLIFAFTVASFYGMTAARGNTDAWGKVLTHGIIAGDSIGNAALVSHLVSAVFIILAGALQLIPQVRQRYPVFHRWLGRFYITAAFTISLAGLYLMFARGTVGDLSQHLGTGLMAVLIMLCAVMALRYALARDFKTHRRWALRLYLVVSASLFIRIGIFGAVVLHGGPFGFDPATFTGPFLTFISFAQYLVPLAVLELYFLTQDRPTVQARFTMAAFLFLLTLGMGAGLFAVSAAAFLPNIQKAFDARISIADTLSPTLASNGIDAAATQYRQLKASAPATYNFDEDELNAFGYKLLQAKKFSDAIRIFQLNVEAYPQSANTYDSLAEAYLDADNKRLAIANYQRALQLNPKSANAAKMLQKLDAPTN